MRGKTLHESSKMTKHKHDQHRKSHKDSAVSVEPEINWQNVQLDFGQVTYFSEKGFGFLASLFHPSHDRRKEGGVFFHIRTVKSEQARQDLEQERGNRDIDLHFWYFASDQDGRGWSAVRLWPDFRQVPSEALAAALDQTINLICHTSLARQSMKTLCAQLFGDARISNDRLQPFFRTDYFRNNPAEVVKILRPDQFLTYAQHLDLEAKWRDVSKGLPQWIEAVTEQLLGDNKLQVLKHERHTLQEKSAEEKRIATRRRQQEMEARQREQQAAEAKRREEETRLAQARTAQEERNRTELAARHPRSGGRIPDGQRSLKENWREFAAVLNQVGCTRLYHFTDRSNLSSIQQLGGLFSWVYLESNGIHIPRPGGGDLSRRLDRRRGLEDYVRLSFNSDQPMMHVALREGHIVDPVILEIDPRVVFWSDTWFSNMNATTFKFAPIIGPNIEHFQSIEFDFAIGAQRWLNEIQKSYCQAEVMVKTHIPLTYILNFNQIYQPAAHLAARW